MSRSLAILLAVLGGALLGAAVSLVALLRLKKEAQADSPAPAVATARPEKGQAGTPGPVVATPDSDPRDPPATPPIPLPAEKPPVLPAEPSYYLSNFRETGLAIREMTPIVLTPLEREKGLEDCPELLVVRSGAGSYDRDIQPYLEALAAIALPIPPDGARLGREATLAIRQRIENFRTIVAGPVGTPPLRVMIKHYPRVDLDGQCVTVQIVFYTVPDPHFDREVYAAIARAGRLGAEIRGTLLQIRKTYRLDGGAARLIEAEAEAQTEVRQSRRRPTFASLSSDEEVRWVGMDSAAGAHFVEVGEGLRLGLYWVDRSVGKGDARPASFAYRIVPSGADAGPVVESEPLPTAVEKAFLGFVGAA